MVKRAMDASLGAMTLRRHGSRGRLCLSSRPNLAELAEAAGKRDFAPQTYDRDSHPDKPHGPSSSKHHVWVLFARP
jgi:hypothetical protein